MAKINGYTLIELLIVLTIIGIISAIGIPSLTAFWHSTQEDILLTTLQRAIYLTRSAAIARQQSTTLSPSQNNAWQTGFIITSAQQTLYTFQNFSSNGHLFWRSFPRNQQHLEFRPTGLPNAQNGTFWFCPADKTKPVWAMMVNRGGRARVLYPDRAGQIFDDKGIVLDCTKTE